MPKPKANAPATGIEKFHGYEFFGPLVFSVREISRLCLLTCDCSPGAFVISFGLPAFCYVMLFFCNDKSGCPAPSLLHPSTLSWEQLKQEIGWPGVSGLLSTKAVLGTLGYYLLSLALYAFLPAETIDGTQLRTGGKLKYRFNGKTPNCMVDHEINF